MGTLSVVVATRNRPDHLKRLFEDLDRQMRVPDLVVVVDASDRDAAIGVREIASRNWRFRSLYLPAERSSAARQRNQGALVCATELIVFLDDDVRLDGAFLKELVKPFENDPDGRIGAVSGTIVNQTYSPPGRWNRLALRICLGPLPQSLSGRLVGPAVNFLPEDRPDAIQEVDWLPSGCTAYRRAIFLLHRFPEHFEGYSFAEDVHLSARVAKTHRLLNTTRARLYHNDTGRETHRDWRALGESMVRHRHEIMTGILGRRRGIDYWQLFAYEIIYSSLAWLVGVRPLRPSRLLALLGGKLKAFYALWRESRQSRGQQREQESTLGNNLDLHQRSPGGA